MGNYEQGRRSHLLRVRKQMDDLYRMYVPRESWEARVNRENEAAALLALAEEFVQSDMDEMAVERYVTAGKKLGCHEFILRDGIAMLQMFNNHKEDDGISA